MARVRVSRLSVKCPRCFMPRGVLCQDERGWHMTLGHIERLYLARAAEREREKEESRG